MHYKKEASICIFFCALFSIIYFKMCDNNIVDIPISWEFGKESIYEKPNNRKKH